MARTFKDAPRFVQPVKPPKKRKGLRADPINSLSDDEDTHVKPPSGKVMAVLQDAYERLSAVYQLYNWSASGGHLEQWPRVDHESIHGKVYATLAPVHQSLAALLTKDPHVKAEIDAAERNIRLKVAEDLQQAHDKTMKEMTVRYNIRLKVLREERREVAKMLARAESRYHAVRGELEAEFEARVEARVLEITSGVPNTGTRRKVFL